MNYPESARSHQQVLFIENLVRPHVIQDELNVAYKLMAEDIDRETEAFEWAESLIGDVDRIDNEECWMISIVPIPNPDQAIRQHDAFLNGYAPEDEGLYVIKDELNADYKLMAEDVERETEAFEWAESLIGDVDQ